MVFRRPTHVGRYQEYVLHKSFRHAREAVERMARRAGNGVLNYRFVLEKLVGTPGIYFGPGIRMDDVLKGMEQLGWIAIEGPSVRIASWSTKLKKQNGVSKAPGKRIASRRSK